MLSLTKSLAQNQFIHKHKLLANTTTIVGNNVTQKYCVPSITLIIKGCLRINIEELIAICCDYMELFKQENSQLRITYFCQ